MQAAYMNTKKGLLLAALLLVQLTAGCTGVLDSTVNPRAVLTATPMEIQQGEGVTFDARGSDAIEGIITEFQWDFGDGTTGVGSEIDHQFEEPGVYTITSTSITSEDVYTSSIEVLVHLEASAEVDNMECACAPTGKDTTVDLLALPGTMSIEGYLTVEHDGSSESCSQINPLQECHLRVILERTESGEVVSQDVLYDSTFRTNEVVIDFNLQDMTFEQGDGINLRLETDQLRDWHKPTADWSSTAPVVA